ncbi:hypothetical protein DFH06DRAFT_1139986 [Mycena polygramma]|nr:hypothetical protein DFH06DRAFT_1139986 [Mycena polygramma]
MGGGVELRPEMAIRGSGSSDPLTKYTVTDRDRRSRPGEEGEGTGSPRGDRSPNYGIEPVFPPELEREILETTALMYPEVIPTLISVARRVFTWIEPLQYRVIILSDRTDTVDAVRALRLLDLMKSKPPEFSRVVRHLALWDPQIPWDDTTQLLDLCKGGHKFLLFLRVGSSPASDLGKNAYSAAVSVPWPPFRIWTHILALPALTHLGLYNVPRDSVLTALADCPRFKLLVLLCPMFPSSVYESAKIPHVYDVRFVIGVDTDYYLEDWEDGASGRPDLWARGDEFVARKRKGDIEGTVSPLHHGHTLFTNESISATRYWLT